MTTPAPLVRDVDPSRLLATHFSIEPFEPYAPNPADAALDHALAAPGLTLVVHKAPWPRRSPNEVRRATYEALLRTRAEHPILLFDDADDATLDDAEPHSMLWVDLTRTKAMPRHLLADRLRQWMMKLGRDAVVIVKDAPPLDQFLARLAELRLNPRVVEIRTQPNVTEQLTEGRHRATGPVITADAYAEDLYRDADGPTRKLLRRASLLEPDEVLNAETVMLLLPDMKPTDAWPFPRSLVPQTIPWTAFQHHLAEDPETLVDEIRFALQRQRVARRGAQPRPHIVRDYWTTDDHLGYRAHADAIATFIRHPDSRPPLTIGIKGPWGAGKTSLMRMVREDLDDERDIELTGRSRRKLTQGRRKRADARVTNADVLRHSTETGTEEDLAVDPPQEDWRATVWFNPWMYQSTEQVWAGLAHAIIGQITDRLRPGDRERFWLELNLARLDRLAVRRRAYRLFVEKLLPVLAAFVLVAGAAGILWAIGVAEAVTRWTLAGGAGVLLVGGAVRYLAFRAQPAVAGFGQMLSGPAQGLFDEAAPDPGYAGKAGFLHLVHHDMRRVLKLVATEDRPLVVFVDDLDRCSPGVVAEVVEAVNLFLAGEFENCVFVVAMEPDVLAAHVEVAYADLVDHLGKEGGELGWRFLEKIVQLPMSLPAINEEQHVPTYLRALLGVRDEPHPEPVTVYPKLATSQTPAPSLEPPASRISTFDVDLLARAIVLLRSRRPTLRTLTYAIDAVAEILGQGAPSVIARSVTLKAAETVYAELFTDKVAYDAIGAALPALRSANPREIKRYVNLFRFYSFITFRRRATGTTAPDNDQLAKLAAFAIRWPDLLGAAAPAITQLEDAAHDDTTWETALDHLDCLRDAPARRAALRTFLTTGPPIGTVAHTVL